MGNEEITVNEWVFKVLGTYAGIPWPYIHVVFSLWSLLILPDNGANGFLCKIGVYVYNVMIQIPVITEQ